MIVVAQRRLRSVGRSAIVLQCTDTSKVEDLTRTTKIQIVPGWEFPSDALQFPLRELKSLAFLLQTLPATLDIGQLLQVFLGSVQTTGSGDPKTSRQSRLEPTIPVQSPQEFLIDCHWYQVRETLERD